MKRIVVIGAHDWWDRAGVQDALYEHRPADGSAAIVVHGEMRGASSMAREVAESWEWPTEAFPAKFGAYGKNAIPRQHQRMIDAGAAVVLAFPLPADRARIADLIGRASHKLIPIRIYRPTVPKPIPRRRPDPAPEPESDAAAQPPDDRPRRVDIDG